MAGRGSKPGERRGGREKGTPNKINGDIREMLKQALEESGGVEYFKKQAKENPTSFNTLLAKVIPAEVIAKVDYNYVIRAAQPAVTPEQWQQQHPEVTIQ